MIERLSLDERDLRSLINKTPRDVDAVIMLLDNAGQIQAFLKQWSELRKDRPEIFTDDLIVYLDPPEDIGRYGFTFHYATPKFEEDRLNEFRERYKKAYHEEPQGASASVAYDVTALLLECVARDGSSETVRNCVADTHITDCP